MGEYKRPFENIHPALSGFYGSLIAAAFTLAIYAVARNSSSQYGMLAFIGIPLALGIASSVIAGPKDVITYGRCAACTGWSLLMVTVGLLCWQWEGYFCLLMAAPIVIPVALIGALIGFGIRKAMSAKNDRQAPVTFVVLLLPAMFIRDVYAPPEFVTHSESTSVIIDAPPEAVWRYVCEVHDLPPATELLFKAGIAYPVSIELPEPREGGRRVCKLSTGDMPEVVEVFEPNRRLVFRVVSTPETMKESNPFGEIHPKHLSGYFKCLRGEFVFERLPGGKTRLTGTSWYASRIAPDAYWRLWNDMIVDEVHTRVMNEIRSRALRDVSRKR